MSNLILLNLQHLILFLLGRSCPGEIRWVGSEVNRRWRFCLGDTTERRSGATMWRNDVAERLRIPRAFSMLMELLARCQRAPSEVPV